MNNTVMKFPTETDQSSYECILFMLTSNCGYSKRVKKFTCSHHNPENAGKEYFGCKDRYSSFGIGCSFFLRGLKTSNITFTKNVGMVNYAKKTGRQQ